MVKFKKGAKVRLTEKFKREQKSGVNKRHIEEFGDSVGIMVGLYHWSMTPVGPEIDVAWGPDYLLKYLYLPEHLEYVPDIPGVKDD